jgi:hypothetical protein
LRRHYCSVAAFSYFEYPLDFRTIFHSRPAS